MKGCSAYINSPAMLDVEAVKKNKTFNNFVVNNLFLKDVEYGCGGDAGEEDSDDQEFDYNRDQYEDYYNAREHRHLPDTIDTMDREAYRRFQLNDDELN